MRALAVLVWAAATVAAAYVIPTLGEAESESAPTFVTKIPAGYRDWRLISVAREEGELNDIRAVLGNDTPEASVAGEVIPSREFYDYEAKYLDDRSQVIIPADLSPAVSDEIRRLSISAFRSIDCAGMARVDFLLSRTTGQIVVNEVNTIPGFTTISMYSKLWAATGVDYATLLDRLVSLALERHAGKQQLRTSLT